LAREEPVLVVGAGLVGLACAYSLARRGVRPLVIDAGFPGSGASSGNAGWVAFAPEIVAPVPAPRVLRMSLRWLLQRNSPLRLVPRLELDYLRWLARFVVSCSSDVAAAGLRSTLAFNAETADLFDDLEREGPDFEMERSGLLVVHRSRRSFDAAWRTLLEAGGPSAEGQVLTREEALAAEPLLAPIACAGAIRYDADRHVRPDKLIDALVGRLQRLGVEIRTGSPCLEVLRAGRRVVGIRTPGQTIRAGAYVLAAGTGIPSLARQVGARIPIEGGRGCSFDVPRDELPLRSPVKIYEARLALTPFRDVTRVAGMMELGARTPTVRPRAIEAMNRSGAASFRAWPTTRRDAWAGLRPMTPDGLPVIGRVGGVENLYVAGGHGMLGLTLSLRTGEAIARCLGHGPNDQAVLPFVPNRFARRVRALAS
jgi:D-amino-acid dehydrogenase